MKNIEIYKYDGNNEYTKREVYPATEPPPSVPKGMYLGIGPSSRIVPNDKTKYARPLTDDAPPVIRYKMVIRNNGEISLIRKFTDLCKKDPSVLVENVGAKDEIDALASVCERKLPTDSKKAKYKKDIANALDDYHKKVTARREAYEWAERWHSQNKDTIG
jgi:hypothetical protein